MNILNLNAVLISSIVAGVVSLPGTGSVSGDSTDVFRSKAHRVVNDPDARMWLHTRTAIEADRYVLKFCRTLGNPCPEPAQRALNFLRTVQGEQGSEVARAINTWVNEQVLYLDDAVFYGKDEYWAPPLLTLLTRLGDCDDIAILKYALLLEAGMPPESVRMVSVSDKADSWHMTVAFYTTRWLILDGGIFEDMTYLEQRNLKPQYVYDGDGTYAISYNKVTTR